MKCEFNSTHANPPTYITHPDTVKEFLRWSYANLRDFEKKRLHSFLLPQNKKWDEKKYRKIFFISVLVPDFGPWNQNLNILL